MPVVPMKDLPSAGVLLAVGNLKFDSRTFGPGLAEALDKVGDGAVAGFFGISDRSHCE
jgi:hypothetical protein